MVSYWTGRESCTEHVKLVLEFMFLRSANYHFTLYAFQFSFSWNFSKLTQSIWKIAFRNNSNLLINLYQQNDFITIYKWFALIATMDDYKCVSVLLLLLSIWWDRNHLGNWLIETIAWIIPSAICNTNPVQRTSEIFSKKKNSRNFHKNGFSLSIRRDVKVLESLNIEHTKRSQYFLHYPL